MEMDKSNWKYLMKVYNAQTHFLDNYVANLGIINDEKSLKDIRAFYSRKENMREDIKTEKGRTLELIEANIRFNAFNDN